MELYTPLALILFVLVPLILWALLRRGYFANLRFSSVEILQSARSGFRIRGRALLLLLRVGCLVCLILALARPREGNQQHKITRNAAVMQLVVDRSSSMTQLMDYDGQSMTRFEVVKRVLADFIQGGNGLPGRENDLLGLITFARYSDTVCPLVYSHDILAGFLKEARTATTRNEDGTAIGEGITLAAARLKSAEHDLAERNARLGQGEASDFEINSRVIILLTDGRNSVPESDPLAAADLAKEWGIKIYTIGIGSPARQQRGIFSFSMGQDLDEGLLREIANRTGGFYGRADDAEALREVCDRIDAQEKSEIESIEYSIYEERFMPLALAALVCLVLEMGLATTVLRKIP
jgi:Ca-activated chloride channel family protein